MLIHNNDGRNADYMHWIYTRIKCLSSCHISYNLHGLQHVTWRESQAEARAPQKLALSVYRTLTSPPQLLLVSTCSASVHDPN